MLDVSRSGTNSPVIAISPDGLYTLILLSLPATILPVPSPTARTIFSHFLYVSSFPETDGAASSTRRTQSLKRPISLWSDASVATLIFVGGDV